MLKDEASVPGKEKRRGQSEMKLLELAGPGRQGLVVMLGFCLIYKSKEKLLKGLSSRAGRSDFYLEKPLWLQYEEVRAGLGQMRGWGQETATGVQVRDGGKG